MWTYNCDLTDANGVKFMMPIRAEDLDDASIRMQLYLEENGGRTRINRIVRAMRDWASR